MIRRSVHEQLQAAFDGSGLSAWELARRANVRQSLVAELVGDSGRAQVEALERVAGALNLDVLLAPSSPPLHIVSEVRTVVDTVVMRLAPDECTVAVQRVPHVLALDLEGVIVSNAVSIFPRAGLHRFLTCVRGLFSRVVMFTTVSEPRFRQIAHLLVEEGVAPAWFESVEYVVWTGKTKDLRFVPAAEVDDILLVDDLELYVDPEQHAQWVPIAGFEPPFTQEDDRELDRVLEELTRRVCPAP